MPSTLIAFSLWLYQAYGFLIVMRTTPFKAIEVFFVVIGLGPEHL